MNQEELKAYAEKLTEDEIEAIHDKLTRMGLWSGIRLSIKKMAAYLVRVHPELYVELQDWSCDKDTKPARSRLRIPGSREYRGYRLKVWRSFEDHKKDARYGNLIDHDTTETYRKNYEVARKIINYEKEKEGN